MAQAYGVPAFPVDTHIHRLAQRWGLSAGKNVLQTETDLKRLFPQDTWNKLHLQIIFYGREHCTARGCDGTICRLCRELYPKRNKPVLSKKA
jgi:endonuclease-3